MARILLIDDNTDILEILVKILGRLEHEVITAASGEEAIAKIIGREPDLILLDIMMPGMDGLQVLGRIRSKPHLAKIPVIVLSVVDDVNVKVQAFEAGADDYLVKTVAQEELLARIQAILERIKALGASKPTSRPDANVIGVIGAKGGVGTSTVALNLATSLMHKQHQVVLCELQGQRGTFRHMLNMSPSVDVGELLQMELSDINAKQVRKRLVRHASSLSVLFAPNVGADQEMTAVHAKAILAGLSEEADYVVLDIPNLVGKGIRALVEAADQLLLVVEPEPLSLACAGDVLSLLRRWKMVDHTAVVALNRSRASMAMTIAECQQRLGKSILTVIPPLPEAFQESAHLGMPVVSFSLEVRASQALREIAEWVMKTIPNHM